jgi:catalase
VYAVNPEATQEWRVMNSPPVMAVATPDAFFKQLQVLWPILLQKSDALKIKKLFVDHPESRVFNQWSANYVLLIVSHLSIITVLMPFLVNGSSL